MFKKLIEQNAVVQSAKKAGRSTLSKALGAVVIAVMLVILIPNLSGMVSAAIDQSDLYNFVNGVVVRDADGQEVTDGNFYYGSNYTFYISFTEIATADGQFVYNNNNRLTYKLPTQIKVLKAVAAGEIRVANGNVVGWYNIDTNGNVEVWFGNFDNNGNPSTKNFIDNYTNASFTLEIIGTFTQGSGNGTILFGSDASIVVKLDYPPPSLSVVKTSTPDINNGTIQYNIAITAIGSPGSSAVKIQSLTDLPWLNTNSSIATASESAYSGFQYRIGNSGSWTTVSPFPGWSNASGNNRTRFNYPFPGNGLDLAIGQTLNVQFTADLNTLISGNTSATGGSSLQYDFTVGNEAQVTSSAGPSSDTTSDHVVKNPITKTASYNAAAERVDYTVTVAAPAGSSLTVNTFRDAPWIGSSNTKFSAASNSAYSNFQYQIGSGTKTGFTPIWDTSNRRWDYTFPGGVVIPAGQKLTITYSLSLQELLNQNKSYGSLLEYNFTLGNNATITTPIGSGSAGTQTPVSKTNPIKKTASYSPSTEKVTYTVTVTAPSGGSPIIVNSFQDVTKAAAFASGVTPSAQSARISAVLSACV